jgi:hypothetical protein
MQQTMLYLIVVHSFVVAQPARITTAIARNEIFTIVTALFIVLLRLLFKQRPCHVPQPPRASRAQQRPRWHSASAGLISGIEREAPRSLPSVGFSGLQTQN